MQTGHKKELPKRSRYYQSVADVSTTPTGAKYRHLPDNILIFICTFDPFDRAFPRYTFQYTCDEDPELKLQDGSLRIFLNATATELSDLDQKLQAFYHYLQEGTAESTLTKEISSKIRTLKNNSLARRHYMTLALKMADIRYDAFEEGLEQGREDGFQVGFQDGVAKGIEQGIEQGIEKGIEQGIEQGIERGAYQKALETARSMLCEGLDPQMVARCTNLPLDVVQELAQTK